MDFNRIGKAAAKSSADTIVNGRVCQADADFFAHQCARLEEPLSENVDALKSLIETVRKKTGSTHINLHLTMDRKGGRYEIATVKPYQEKRSKNVDEEKRARVWELRNIMAVYNTKNVSAVPWYHQEADDGMTQYQQAAIDAGHGQLSVIYSGDKDLDIANGLHMRPSTGQRFKVDGYGHAKYVEVGNVKPKLLGQGTCWFWHQMLMGDTADNIPGLPKLTGKLANRYLPLKKPNPKRADLLCGEAKAVAVLSGCQSDSEAYARVIEAYRAYYGSRALGDEMFVEQALLLWMRRYDETTDVLTWLGEIGAYHQLTTAQAQRLAVHEQYVENMRKSNEIPHSD